MKRILIIGTSCAGKSTLARKLSDKLNIKHTELDQLFWKENWVKEDDDTFLSKLKAVVAQEAWIICGNYSRYQPQILPRATAIIWLDYSLGRILYRGISRTIKRIVTKEKLFSNNIETFSKSFLSFDSILLWIFKTYRRHRRVYAELFRDDEYKIRNYFRFKNPDETDAFLKNISL